MQNGFPFLSAMTSVDVFVCVASACGASKFFKIELSFQVVFGFGFSFTPKSATRRCRMYKMPGPQIIYTCLLFLTPEVGVNLRNGTCY